MTMMTGHLFLTAGEKYKAEKHTTGDGAYVHIGTGILAIHGTGEQFFALATALLDAVNLCPPFPEPEYLTGGPMPAPTRDGDDLADWIDPIVRGEVAS